MCAQRVGRQHRDRHAGALGGGPQPVERPIGQPAPHRLGKKPVAQAQHARLAAPRLDEGAPVRRAQREGAEDGEAAGKVSHGLEGHLGRAGVPARRVDHGGVDTTLVHEAHGLLGGERGDLAMGHVAGQTAAPEMDLSIHDTHLSLRGRLVTSRCRLRQASVAIQGYSGPRAVPAADCSTLASARGEGNALITQEANDGHGARGDPGS